jgi:hypothetical protein
MLVKRAQAWDADALAAVELERRSAAMQSLVPGSLAAWIDRRAGGDPVVRLVLERQVDELRGETLVSPSRAVSASMARAAAALGPA